MSLKDVFARMFGQNPEKKIKKLLGQIELALADLQLRVADCVAHSSGYQKQIERDKALLANTASEKETERENIEARVAALASSLQAERQAEERLRQIYEDLKNRRHLLELSYQQSISRMRNAELKNMLSELYQDYGNEMQLNKYLEKFSEDSFKIEFTADCRLKIEMMLDKANKS
ncbi:MAG: hypothetical protein CVV42_17720 [Candidatus Riflebacteria bacterium HGW-Riflebacteria-2]|jgi:replicative superfamily II helicase|nr:MAG: hypothetical protein CVV42_17720 [Candidatus Riflebacteria bacterium HGW-Riflebacteria-2]